MSFMVWRAGRSKVGGDVAVQRVRSQERDVERCEWGTVERVECGCGMRA